MRAWAVVGPSGQPATARNAREDISPAEEQTFPYDADIPGCQDTDVLATLANQFAECLRPLYHDYVTSERRDESHLPVVDAKIVCQGCRIRAQTQYVVKRETPRSPHRA